MTQQVALVTGASSGIGKATAELLAKNGFYVFAMARRKDRLEQVRSDNIESIPLDATDVEAMRAAIDHIVMIKGRIDVLFNNAGFGQLGAVECVSMEVAHCQFAVNVFGYARFMQAVLPYMREQKSGCICIVNISSILGKIALHGLGWHAASKHAVEALSESLRGEDKAFGIDTIVIAPGLIKTEFAAKQFELLKTVKHPSAYQKIILALHHLLAGESEAPNPEIIARAVVKSVIKSIPPIRTCVTLGFKNSCDSSRWLLGGRFFAWPFVSK